MERDYKSWQVTTADGVHIVEYYPPAGFKKAQLLVDGEELTLAPKPGYIGYDMPILSGGGHDIRFVCNGKKDADISYDGVYVDSGDIYESQRKIPVVNWITITLSGFAFMLGGLIPALCAAGGVLLGSFVAANKNLKNSTKIILGIVIALLTWGLAFGLSVLTGKGITAVEKKLDKSFGKAPYSITLTRDFDIDNDTAELADEGYDVVFGAYSEDAYVYATTITEKKFKLLYGAEPSEEEYLKVFWQLDEGEVRTTEKGYKYFETSNDSYTYIISVCRKAGSYFETQMFCLNENAKEMVPKMLGWLDSITIADAEETPAE